MQNTTYDTQRPKDILAPVILSAPHAGREFPDSFLAQSPLSRPQLLATADLGTDELIHGFGALTNSARYARSFVDLNRPRNWLDPAVVHGAKPRADTQVLAGYGVIPRYAGRGSLTQHGKISLATAEARLRDYYDPYHFALQCHVNFLMAQVGRAVIIDVHSAPAIALGSVEAQFGTQFGRTMNPAYIDAISDCFISVGIKTARDYPFAGGHITKSYASLGVQTIQIEVNRSVINDQKFRKKWRHAMSMVIALFSDRAAAAE